MPKADNIEILTECRRRVQRLPVSQRAGMIFTADDVHRARYEAKQKEYKREEAIWPTAPYEPEPDSVQCEPVPPLAEAITANELMMARGFLRSFLGDWERAVEAVKLVVEVRK